jgi:hypothetical protein
MMSQFSSGRPDIVIKSPEGRILVSVEVKNRDDLTRTTAIKLRYMLATEGLLLLTPYFLLVSQEKGYLWEDIWSMTPDAPPIYEFPMDAVVARYLKRKVGTRLYRTELEFLILQWLTDLAAGALKSSEEPEMTLAIAGFNDAIREAVVLLEDVA